MVVAPILGRSSDLKIPNSDRRTVLAPHRNPASGQRDGRQCDHGQFEQGNTRTLHGLNSPVLRLSPISGRSRTHFGDGQAVVRIHLSSGSIPVRKTKLTPELESQLSAWILKLILTYIDWRFKIKQLVSTH
jgi:hypothetical protein